MIPARIGSTRLKMKNLALINQKPLISYAINAAKNSNVFERIIVNSENEIFSNIANEYDVEFYRRPYNLGSSETKSDEVVYDFISRYKEHDILVWVNPIAPFQTGDEINKIINHFIDNNLDSLITVEEKGVHCMYNNAPINFTLNGSFAQTQDLVPVKAFAYTLMVWKSSIFKKEYSKSKSALFCGNFGTFPINSLSGIIIKTQHDLMLADLIMRGINKNQTNYKVKYHPLSLELT